MRMGRRRALVVAGFAVAAVVALAAGLHFGGRVLRGAQGEDAAMLYGVTLPDTQGNEQALAQWKGKVLVVNFWATWCAPCREEMPQFVDAQRELGPKGLQFVGIAVDSADKVSEFAKELGLNYPALIGGYGAMELSRTLGNGVMALPFTVVVGRDGKIVYTQLGPLPDNKLRSLAGALL
jgi:peroxiredoxin